MSVEANPRLLAVLREAGPEDVAVNLGVGPERGALPFCFFSDGSGRNTFAKAAADSRAH